MILPRRLMRLANGDFCEADDPKQAMNFHGPGFIMPDGEAERIGLKAYLDATGYGPLAVTAAVIERPAMMPETKAVAQAEVEDKAVAGPSAAKAEEMPAPPDAPVEEPAEETPDPEQPPSLSIPPEARRQRGR